MVKIMRYKMMETLQNNKMQMNKSEEINGKTMTKSELNKFLVFLCYYLLIYFKKLLNFDFLYFKIIKLIIINLGLTSY